MPSIVAYDLVLKRAKEMRLKCTYHNSGAFVFLEEDRAQSVGWIGPADPTIRPEMRSLARPVAPPFEHNLSRLLVDAWRELAPRTSAWVMPVSHWAYELQFGSRDWMPALLEEMGIDPHPLTSRNQADAIAFAPEEAEPLQRFAQRLLEKLLGSDFAVIFPDHPVLARLHHHKQIWWTTTSPEMLVSLQRLSLHLSI